MRRILAAGIALLGLGPLGVGLATGGTCSVSEVEEGAPPAEPVCVPFLHPGLVVGAILVVGGALAVLYAPRWVALSVGAMLVVAGFVLVFSVGMLLAAAGAFVLAAAGVSERLWTPPRRSGVRP